MQSVLKEIQDRSDGGATICGRTIITVQDLDPETQAAIWGLLGQKRHRVSIALDYYFHSLSGVARTRLRTTSSNLVRQSL